MAKKNDKIKNKQEELELIDEDIDEGIENEPNKKGRGCLFKLIIAAIIFIIIVSIPVAIIGFNVGNIRDRYLRPGLERIPIINNLLPPLEEGQIEEQPVDEQQQTIDSLTAEIEELNKEIARLREFEQTQLEFRAEKEEFDRMIALNDPQAYTNFYESISPENAEELYKQAVNQQVTDKEFKDYIQTFETMKKDAATTILEELIITDMDLVITILDNLSSKKRSEILGAMDPQNAASCSRLLSPIQE